MGKAYAGPRVLTLDIETVPLSASVWGTFDQNVGLNQINSDWAVCTVAGKYLHKREVMYEDTRLEKDIRNDQDLIIKIADWLADSNIVVGHNIKSFDLKKIKARAIQLGYRPFPMPEVIDTLSIARQVAKFTSNKLEYLSDKLTHTAKSTHTKFPGFSLWSGIMRGDWKAWDEMRKYNIQDVKATEALYKALRPWASSLPSLAKYYEDPEDRCPRCGTKSLVPNGFSYTKREKYQRYTCTTCYGFCRGTRKIGSKRKEHEHTTCI